MKREKRFTQASCEIAEVLESEMNKYECLETLNGMIDSLGIPVETGVQR